MPLENDPALVPAPIPVDPAQLELFTAFVGTTPADYANVFELLDSVMIFSSDRVRPSAAPDVRMVTLRGMKSPIEVQIWPATFADENGQTKFVMPGKREELVERTIRKLASENIRQLGMEQETSDAPGVGGGPPAKTAHVAVHFRLNQLRRLLRQTGHDFKLTELRQALYVLNRARIDFKKDGVAPSHASDPRLTRLTDGSTFLQRVQTVEDPKDKTGDRVLYKVTLNPLASAAILERSYRLIDFTTLMSLNVDLARWLYTRLANRYKQASHEAAWSTSQQYHIALATILAESGAQGYSRMRDNLRMVREALAALKSGGIIDGFTEQLERGRTPGQRGPAQVVGAVWNIIPSPKFIDDAVRSNVRFTPQRRLSEKKGE